MHSKRIGEAGHPGPGSEAQCDRDRALAALQLLGGENHSDEDYASCGGDAGTTHDAGSGLDCAQSDPYQMEGGVSEACGPTDAYEDVRPQARARLAVRSMLALVSDIVGRSERDTRDRILQQAWSSFNCPLMWAAAGQSNDHPILAWLESVLAHGGVATYAVGDARVTPSSLRASWRGLRQSLVTLGIQSADALQDWLERSGFQCSGVGGHFSGEAQEVIFDQCAAIDGTVYVLENSYAAVAHTPAQDQVMADHLRRHLLNVLGVDGVALGPNASHTSGRAQRGRQRRARVASTRPGSIPGVASGVRLMTLTSAHKLTHRLEL